MKPTGFTDAELDVMDKDLAITIWRNQKTEKAASDKEGKTKAVVGRVQTQKKAVVTLTHYDEHDDDGESVLHPARWLAPPTCDPRIFWAQMPIKRDVKPPHLDKVLGLELDVAEEVWEEMFSRNISQEFGAFLPNNYLAMEEGAFYDLKTRGDELKIKGRSGNFKPPETVRQAKRALLNMQGVYRQVWPENYCADVLSR